MSAMRIAIGPLNQASQGRAWAEALRTYRGVDAISFAPNGPLARRLPGFPNTDDPPHVSIPRRKLAPEPYRVLRLRQLCSRYDHVFGESFVDVAIISPTAMILHGSEIRDPDRHASWFPDSYFRSAPLEWVDRLRRVVRSNQARLDEFPTFVSTPDLLLDCPSATWLPLVVDVAAWSSQTGPDLVTGMSVLHIPSRRTPPIKGTQFVDPALAKLSAQGVCNYISPNSVSHAAMRPLVQGADIVIDQLLTGSYGVAAVEALAAGRLVVGNVHPDVRDRIADDVPIIDAAPDTLESVLKDVLDDSEKYLEIAARGPEFVRKWHDGRAASAALGRHLGLLESDND